MQTDRVPPPDASRPDGVRPESPRPEGPRPEGARLDSTGARGHIARNRRRQRELYGAPLGDRVRLLTVTLGITQARLARTLGMSPAMLSQLASARRVKIGDPAVLARLQLLDRRYGTVPPGDRPAVEALLAEVGRARLHWAAPGSAARDPRGSGARPVGGGLLPPNPADALRAVAPPARLAAAAATLAPAFPELAEVLRQAAGPDAARPGSGSRPASRRPW